MEDPYSALIAALQAGPRSSQSAMGKTAPNAGQMFRSPTAGLSAMGKPATSAGPMLPDPAAGRRRDVASGNQGNNPRRDPRNNQPRPGMTNLTGQYDGGWYNPYYDPNGPKNQEVPDMRNHGNPNVFYTGAQGEQPEDKGAGLLGSTNPFGEYANEGKLKLNAEQQAAANWYDRKRKDALIYGPAGYSQQIRENIGTDDKTVGYGDDPQQYRSGMTGGGGVDIGTVGPVVYPPANPVAGATPAGPVAYTPVGAAPPVAGAAPAPSSYTPIVTPSEDYEIGESNIGATPAERFPSYGNVNPMFPNLNNGDLRQAVHRLDKKFDPVNKPRVNRYERQNSEPLKADYGTMREYLEARLEWQRGRRDVAQKQPNKVADGLKG